jgi:hypothetical protein
MWPPTDSVVPHQLVGECHSCGRDLNGSLPKLPIEDPSALLDTELVALWRFWSQARYGIACALPEPVLIAEFRGWLIDGTIEVPQVPELDHREIEFVAAFRAGHTGTPEGVARDL